MSLQHWVEQPLSGKRLGIGFACQLIALLSLPIKAQ